MRRVWAIWFFTSSVFLNKNCIFNMKRLKVLYRNAARQTRTSNKANSMKFDYTQQNDANSKDKSFHNAFTHVDSNCSQCDWCLWCFQCAPLNFVNEFQPFRFLRIPIQRYVWFVCFSNGFNEEAQQYRHFEWYWPWFHCFLSTVYKWQYVHK